MCLESFGSIAIVYTARSCQLVWWDKPEWRASVTWWRQILHKHHLPPFLSLTLHFGHHVTMLWSVISEHICNLESHLSSKWLQRQPSQWILSKTTLFNIFNFNLDRSPGVRSLTGKFQFFFFLSSSASVKWLTSKFSRPLSVWPHLAEDTALAVYWIS